MVISLEQQKALFQQYMDNHEIDKAVTQLCRMTADCARSGRFDLAESYRDLLYEVDSSALVAIMKVNECIEIERKQAKRPDERHSWPEFFKQLSSEEAKAFFSALQAVEISDDHFVLKQGKPNDRLYLVDHGMLKAVFKNRDHDVLIHQLGCGDIFGEDTFFSVNVCTASVVTVSTSHLRFLDHDHLKHLEQAFPVIGSSLERLCTGGKPAYDYLKAKKIDRRAAKRIHLKSPIAVQLLTAESRHPMQRTLRADLWDVSKHGLCFHLQSKNREYVRRMIGRSLGVRIRLESKGHPVAAAVTGMVQGVQNHRQQHYSVHMQLNPPFSDEAMATIERVAALRQ